MDAWVTFTDRETGRELSRYTVEGSFVGETEATRELLSVGRGIPKSQIEIGLETPDEDDVIKHLMQMQNDIMNAYGLQSIPGDEAEREKLINELQRDI